MTSTLGVWILTGYGAAKAPRLMQFSVHCDHLRSVLFVRAGPSPYGEMVAALTTLFRKKMCASIYVHGRGRNFYGLPAFFTIRRKDSGFVKALPPKNSPIYGHGKGQELGAFQIFLSCSPALRRNMGRFERGFSDIRRKTCCFDQVFSQNFFCFLHHTEKRMPFC